MKRRDADEIVIFYDSPRRLCAMARGIVRGASNHYEEPVEITEAACMLRGDERCEIAVRRVPPVT